LTGVSLGATPTAIANMTAVTKLHDIANAAAIGFFGALKG
jgi:sodium--glutamate symport carrier gltS